MKNRNFYTLIFLLFIAFQLLAQETVFVESTQKGKGILKSRSGECFVITPEHVVHEDASILSITGSKNVLSNGKLVQAMEDLDIAIIRVTDGGTQNCTNWSVPSNYTSILDNTVDAYLELRDENGGTQLIQVFINGKDEETISIVPKLSKDIFIKGMSGGSLFTQYQGKKIYLGMLQEIGEEGEGYVFQADDMERILGGFFGDSQKQSSITSMTTTTAEPSANSVEEDGYRFDLLSVKKSGTNVVCKLRVTSLEKDGELDIYGSYGGKFSEMYDQNGHQTKASNVKLANLSHALHVGKNVKLIKGIPVPLEITFKDLDEDASGISYLKIQTYGFKVSFKNISFNEMSSNIEIPRFDNVEFTHEEDGYKFDLISVNKSGNKVVCKLRVTSLEKNGELDIYGSYGGKFSEMYDQNGLQTKASDVKLGNQSHALHIGKYYTLVKDVPVPLEITFKDIDEGATSITNLKIQTYSFNFSFKNISLNGLASNIKTPELESSLFSNENQGYKFDLLSVKKTGSKVVCKLKITSLEKDGELDIYGSYGGKYSEMYDQNGISTKASNVKLGNQSHALHVGRNYILVKGVPVPLDITFKDVSDDAAGISYLKIQTYSFKIEFRNISF